MASYLSGASAGYQLRVRDKLRVVFKPSAVNVFLADFTYGMSRVWSWIMAGGHGLGVVPLSGNPTTTGDKRAVIDFLAPGTSGRTVADVVTALNGVSHLVTVESVALIETTSAVGPNAAAERQRVTDAAAKVSSDSLGDKLRDAAKKAGNVATLVVVLAAAVVLVVLVREVRK